MYLVGPTGPHPATTIRTLAMNDYTPLSDSAADAADAAVREAVASANESDARHRAALEQVADAKARLDDAQRTIDALNSRIINLQQDTSRAEDVLAKYLMDLCSERGDASDYDEIRDDLSRLGIDLIRRKRSYEVTMEVTYLVAVEIEEAEDDEDAAEQAEQMLSYDSALQDLDVRECTNVAMYDMTETD